MDEMPRTLFRVRYRAPHPAGTGSALVVEDAEGSYYLFSGGVLQLRIAAGVERLDAYLARARYPWQRVESDPGHPLAALAALERSLT
jgi:hypothetical protein